MGRRRGRGAGGRRGAETQNKKLKTEMEMVQPEECNWQCNKSLVDSLDHLFTSGIACDVTFLVGEDRHRVSAHKTILISRSPVFYAMLEGTLAEKGEIAVPDMEEDVFTMLLRYLYTDQIKLTVDIATSVLSAARKYMVDHLVTKCETFLESSLTTENVCLVLEQAHIYTEENLKEECLRVIAGSQEKVLKSASFVDLCNVCVKSITESDDLAVEESVVYEAVMRWSETECEREGLEVTDNNRRDVLGDILYTVRFPLIDTNYLSNHVILRDVLTSEQLLSIMRFQKDKKAHPCKEFNVNQRKLSKITRNPVKGQFECIERFGGTIYNEWNSMRLGNSDSISFVASVDMFLHGLQLYGTYQREHYVLIGVYSDAVGGSGMVYMETHVMTPTELCTIQFHDILKITPEQIYTVVLHGGVCTPVFGKEGRTEVECRNGHVRFMETSSHLSGSSSLLHGQIPGLLVSF